MSLQIGAWGQRVGPLGKHVAFFLTVVALLRAQLLSLGAAAAGACGVGNGGVCRIPLMCGVCVAGVCVCGGGGGSRVCGGAACVKVGCRIGGGGGGVVRRDVCGGCG